MHAERYHVFLLGLSIESMFYRPDLDPLHLNSLIPQFHFGSEAGIPSLYRNIYWKSKISAKYWFGSASD